MKVLSVVDLNDLLIHVVQYLIIKLLIICVYDNDNTPKKSEEG